MHHLCLGLLVAGFVLVSLDHLVLLSMLLLGGGCLLMCCLVLLPPITIPITFTCAAIAIGSGNVHSAVHLLCNILIHCIRMIAL